MIFCPFSVVDLQVLIWVGSGAWSSYGAIVAAWFLIPTQLALVLMAFPREDMSVGGHIPLVSDSRPTRWGLEWLGVPFLYALARGPPNSGVRVYADLPSDADKVDFLGGRRTELSSGWRSVSASRSLSVRTPGLR